MIAILFALEPDDVQFDVFFRAIWAVLNLRGFVCEAEQSVERKYVYLGNWPLFCSGKIFL